MCECTRFKFNGFTEVSSVCVCEISTVSFGMVIRVLHSICVCINTHVFLTNEQSSLQLPNLRRILRSRDLQFDPRIVQGTQERPWLISHKSTKETKRCIRHRVKIVEKNRAGTVGLIVVLAVHESILAVMTMTVTMTMTMTMTVTPRQL